MQTQASMVEVRSGLQSALQEMINWFIPVAIRHSRSHRGLARIFVQSHLLLAVATLLMVAQLAGFATSEPGTILFLSAAIAVFATLPFILRARGDMALVTLISFQTLTVVSLVGIYGYGGFASPFLPWLLVSLMSGLFYQSRRVGLVIGLFALDLGVFLAVLLWQAPPAVADDLRTLSWISIAVAMAHMAFMALYYARVTASRDELAAEAERHRLASAELEQARAVAEKVNGDRSQFFAKMSHELRTPLNVVINYSEILLEDCEDSALPDEQRMADLRRINATGRHLLSLVADVFDLDSVERNELTVDVCTTTLGEICDAVIATSKPLVEENGNAMIVNCPLRDDQISTDDKKLRQMLLNLLSNAAKFTSAGTITLELWVERGLADDRLHAAVRDTGIGIAAEVLPHLFETYMQADAAVYSQYGGTGIGLALTRKFSVLLGGQITATSSPGEGSCFTIDIPADLGIRPAAKAETQGRAWLAAGEADAA